MQAVIPLPVLSKKRLLPVVTRFMGVERKCVSNTSSNVVPCKDCAGQL